MTLYVHNPRDNQLHAIWRRKAKRHPASEKGRSWSVGNGHVGIAFAQAEAKICSDSGLEGAGELISAGRHARCYDQVVYASFVSMPIMRGGVEPSDPYGVLVVTSDVPGRFDQGSALPLRHAAAAIAALIELAYSKDDLQAMCDSTATSPPRT